VKIAVKRHTIPEYQTAFYDVKNVMRITLKTYKTGENMATSDDMIHCIKLFPKEGLDNTETARNIEAVLQVALNEAKKRNVGASWTFTLSDEAEQLRAKQKLEKEKPIEISSYEDLDREWKKTEAEIEKLQEKVDAKKSLLTQWVVDHVIALTRKGIYRK